MRLRARRASPLLQMTVALVTLCGTLVLLADLLFGLFPARDAQVLAVRQAVVETAAVQVARHLGQDDLRGLKEGVEALLQRTPDLRSAAVRMADGQLVVEVGDHSRHWRDVDASGRSDPIHLTVPLQQGDALWGSFEMAYAPADRSTIVTMLTSPLSVLMGFLSVIGTVVFGLYLRRALQHLDPASVIPERVQRAFDAMHEGVVVLDVRGRVMLANRAFRALHPMAQKLATGHELSSQTWITAGLPGDPATHPWARAMDERKANAGLTVEIGPGGDDLTVDAAQAQAAAAAGPRESSRKVAEGHARGGEAIGHGTLRRLVINASPISDPSGQVRGCLTTFNDVSDLHRANVALREAMTDLSRVRDEMARKNVELEILSTRDPLSGSLNRRAFFAAAEAAVATSRREGLPLGCLMIDIDHFKAVNDNHGHAIGDRVIAAVAEQLRVAAGPADLVGRYGGEEFCVILPNCPPEGARAQAERIRLAIERHGATAIPEAAGLKVTVSIGLSHADGRAPIPEPAVLIDRADQGLYRAKREGRNRVQTAAPVGQAQPA